MVGAAAYLATVRGVLSMFINELRNVTELATECAVPAFGAGAFF